MGIDSGEFCFVDDDDGVNQVVKAPHQSPSAMTFVCSWHHLVKMAYEVVLWGDDEKFLQFLPSFEGDMRYQKINMGYLQLGALPLLTC